MPLATALVKVRSKDARLPKHMMPSVLEIIGSYDNCHEPTKHNRSWWQGLHLKHSDVDVIFEDHVLGLEDKLRSLAASEFIM